MKKKITMSMSFLTLALYGLLALSGVLAIFGNFINIFRGFSLTKLISFPLITANTLMPYVLLALLYLNTRQDVKKYGQFVLLIAGVLRLYSVVTGLGRLFKMLADGMDIFGMMQMLAGPIASAVVAILLIVGALSLRGGKPGKAVYGIALIGAVAYFIPMGVGVLMGTASVMNILTTLLLIIGVCLLPGTIADYSTCVMANSKNVKLLAIVLVIAMVILLIAGGITSEPSHSSGNGRSCGYCGREFTDSGNTRSIARTGMCSNCTGNYKDLTNWLDSMK